MTPAIVLAGGLGTRLRSVSGELPKPLVTVGSRVFLEYALDALVDAKVPTIYLATSYRSELFQRHFGDSYRNIPLVHCIEPEPLGTGGALRKCFLVNGLTNALVINGDTLFKINLSDLVEFHFSRASLVTLALRSVTDASRYGAVTCGADHRILSFEEKGVQKPGLINGGIYAINASAFGIQDLPEKFSLETDFLQKFLLTLQPFGLISSGYFIDIGIPEDLQRARSELHHAL